MDALWEIYGRSRRERSLTPIPSYSPPPQSSERRVPLHFWERPVATPGEPAVVISSMLTPVVGPIDQENRCIICLDPLPAPTDDGDAPAVQLVCGHAHNTGPMDEDLHAAVRYGEDQEDGDLGCRGTRTTTTAGSGTITAMRLWSPLGSACSARGRRRSRRTATA